MAQTRNAKGRAGDAPMSVPLNTTPEAQHGLDLIAWITGRRELIVCAKDGLYVRGYAPGDDESHEPGMLCLAPGCVAKVVVDSPPAFAQDASVLADAVAKGRLDIVDAKEFAKARPHKEIHKELRAADIARQRARQGQPMEAIIAAEVARQVAALTAPA